VTFSVSGMGLGVVPLQKIGPGTKIWTSLAWNCLGLNQASLGVGYSDEFSLPDFLNEISDRKYNVGSPFHHFGKFLVFNSFNNGCMTYSSLYAQLPSLILFPASIFAALSSGTTKMRIYSMS
jgi:hypothetical protein